MALPLHPGFLEGILGSVRKHLLNWSKLLVKEPGFTTASTVWGRCLLHTKPIQRFCINFGGGCFRALTGFVIEDYDPEQ